MSACPSVRPERRYRSNSLRNSAIGLKFGEAMHSTMKQVVIQKSYVLPIFARATALIFMEFIYLSEIWWDDA